MENPIKSAIEHLERLNASLLAAEARNDAIRLKIEHHLKRLHDETVVLAEKLARPKE